MTRILFERTPNAYLPEIEAYRRYIAAHHPGVTSYDGTAPDGTSCDILWRFMGMDRTGAQAGQYLVHDYNSLSTAPFAKVKNLIKRTANARPDRRVFLSPAVRADFPFYDNIPFHLRDMGIDPAFFARPETAREYDFIYVGGLDRGAVVLPFLDSLAAAPHRTILLIGNADDALRQRYANNPHIVFQGRVPYAEVPHYLAKARYGLNLMPDIYPFNRQTSTKLLEYCAAGLDIVSSRYGWAEGFAKARDASFYWLGPDFDLSGIESFAFRTPDVADLTWDRVIAASGVFDFLKSR